MSRQSHQIAACGPLLAAQSDHHCFGCGAQDPVGLHLAFSATDGAFQAAFTPGVDHQGFEDVVHGGIITTVLDEAMAWAIAAAGIWAVTGEICVRFRRALHVDEPTTVQAAVDGVRGCLVSASATLTSGADDAPIATARAAFIRVDRETELSWRERYLLRQKEKENREQ